MSKIGLFIVALLTSVSLLAQTEPASQASNLNFSGIKTYRANVSFTSSGANGHLVVFSKNPITFTPVDNTTYLKGEVMSGVKVASVGSGTFTLIKNLLQGNSYHVAVFAYNTQGANINYKNTNPLTSIVTTASAGFGNYYNNIDFTASNVVNQLTTLIQPKNKPGVTPAEPMITYNEFKTIFIPDFFEVDTVVAGVTRKYVNCQYSNEKRIFDGTFSFTTPQPQYSREHRTAKSWYDFTGLGTAITDILEGADIHSLDLVQNDVNTSRSNFAFGEIVGNPWADSYLEYKKGRDANNNIVVEPREDRKGDVARANLYMMLAYNGKHGENWGLDNMLTLSSTQDIQVLLDWHFADLPDDFEKTRHEYVYEKQGNRNPLIDFPQLANCIDFTDMTKAANCEVSVGIQDLIKAESGNFVYPNPSTGTLFYQGIKGKDISNIHIYNLLGVEQNNFTFNQDSIEVSKLVKGLYIISLEGKKKHYISKFQLK
jgi:endonuclease I